MSDLDDGQALIAVITTVSTREEAQALARPLVEGGLVACAQISEIESFYRWEGALQQEWECQLLLKTTLARYAEVETALRSTHPYSLPAIYALPVVAQDGAYAQWVVDSLKPERLRPADV